LVERGVILASQGGWVEAEHLFQNRPESIHTGVDAHGNLAQIPNADDDLSARILDSGSSIETIEARVLDLAVQRAGGNLSEAARLLGLSRPQLAYRQKVKQTAQPSSLPQKNPLFESK
jgi:transcriptional regulator with AAA-type ATPase domain